MNKKFYEARREAWNIVLHNLIRTSLINTLILDFRPLELEDYNFLLLRSQSVVFVTAVQEAVAKGK